MTYSQKAIAAFLFAALPLAYACKKADPVADERVTVALNRSARLASGITIRIDTISDFRCPEGYQCITAGYALVSLVLVKGTDSKAIRLTSPSYNTPPGNRRDSATAVFDGIPYKVILRDVIPYPVRDERPKKSAIVQVSKL